jgi:hypothetical protein
MVWTAEQLAEALENIRAMQEGVSVMLLDIAEMRASIIRMQEALDRMNVQFGHHVPDHAAPSICPA